MLEKFPVPVNGTPIPRGWFARLVSFVNSLILRGDGEYLVVNRTNAGTTIRPTTKLIDLLSARAGAPASSGGGSTGIQAAVIGGTASLSVYGSDPLVIRPGQNITLSLGTNGELEISASDTDSPHFPDYSDPTNVDGDVVYGPFDHPVWIIGYVSNNYHAECECGIELPSVGPSAIYDLLHTDLLQNDRVSVPVSIPIPAGVSFVVHPEVVSGNPAYLGLHYYHAL